MAGTYPVQRAAFQSNVCLWAVFSLGLLGSACLSDEVCRTRCECQQRGLCHAQKNACRATTEQDCRSSELCKLRGACTPREGRCVVESAADCEASLGCQKAGLCVPKDGRCKKPE